MSWLQRHAKWGWPVAILAGILLVAVVRLWPGPAVPSATGDQSPRGGVVAAQPADLASAARRIRFLQEQVNGLRQELVAAQTEAASRRSRIAAIDEMLATASLTDCPPFLRDDTTVRALQKIIREAADAPAAAAVDPERLSTAASVARERLRSRLEALRGQLAREVSDLDAQAEALRQRLHLVSSEVERIQRDIHRKLQGRSHGPDGPVG